MTPRERQFEFEIERPDVNKSYNDLARKIGGLAGGEWRNIEALLDQDALSEFKKINMSGFEFANMIARLSPGIEVRRGQGKSGGIEVRRRK